MEKTIFILYISYMYELILPYFFSNIEPSFQYKRKKNPACVT